MTFNIRNGRGVDGRNLWWLRRRATAAVVAGERPDIAGLQEVYRFQLRYLAKRLGGYDLVGVGRNDGAARVSTPRCSTGATGSSSSAPRPAG